MSLVGIYPGRVSYIIQEWFNNLVAEICLFYTQKHKKLFSQARSSRFLYVGYSKIMIQILSKEYEFEITYTFCNQFS